MTGWAPKGDWKKPTAIECYRSCVGNAEQAAKEERDARARLRQLPPGDQRRPKARDDLIRAIVEQPHWRTTAAWWLAEHKRTGAPDLRSVPLPPEPDRRLPREPGDDTDDLPF